MTPAQANADFDALTPRRPESWRREYVSAACQLAKPIAHINGRRSIDAGDLGVISIDRAPFACAGCDADRRDADRDFCGGCGVVTGAVAVGAGA